MSSSYIAGVIVGILVVAVIALIMRKVIKAKGGEPKQYDERQLLVRGRAFAVAYAALLIYLFAWMLLQSLDIPYFSTRGSLLTGILLSIAVFVIYSLFNDAYFRPAERPAVWIGVLSVIGALNIGIGIMQLARGVSPIDVFGEYANLTLGILFVIVLICVFIKRALDKRVEAE